MAGANLTTVSALLKDLYEGPVQEQLNNEVFILQRLASSPDYIIPGNQIVVPLHKTRSGAVGARTEDVDLPSAGNQGFARATYDVKFLYGTGRITGPSMAKTKGDMQAFLRVLEGELNGLRNDLKKDTARQVYGTGDGVIATVGTGSTTTNIVLTSAEALIKGQIYINQVIDIGTKASPQSRVVAGTGVIVSAVAQATLSFTTTACATNPVNGEFVFRQGANGVSTTAEMSGLQQVVSATATFGGIDPTAAGNDYWQANVTAVGGAISQDAMQQLAGKIKQRGGNSTLILTSLGVRRGYFNTLQSQVRYADATKLAGGFESLDFNGASLVTDIDAPFGVMFFLDESAIEISSDQDWHFIDEDGLTIRKVPSRDAYDFAMTKYMNLVTGRRNVQGALTGITDTTGV